MPEYSITVVRDDHRRVPVTVDRHDLDAVVRQALDKARTLAITGCPFGDAEPPRHVEIADEGGDLVLRIAIDPSLVPIEP